MPYTCGDCRGFCIEQFGATVHEFEREWLKMDTLDELNELRDENKDTLEIFIAINESGDWEVSHDQETACTNLIENSGAMLIRVVSFFVQMRRPKPELGPDVVIPDNAGQTDRVAEDVEVKA